jgi:hypothetical protein
MGRNAKETRPAKLLVLAWLLANKGGNIMRSLST